MELFRQRMLRTMPRPRLELGTLGEISVEDLGGGKFRARARFRDFTGKTRQIESRGQSRSAARTALAKKHDKLTDASGVELAGSTLIRSLADAWLSEVESSQRTRQTVEQYRWLVEHKIVPAMGELSIAEVTVSRATNVLNTIIVETPGLGRLCKVVLTGMFDMAVRHDARRTSPIRQVKISTPRKKPVRALSVEEVRTLRRGIHAWQTDENAPAGRSRCPDLLDVVDVMLGTGLRIGEVLALRWSDIDLGEHPKLTVSATLVRTNEAGLFRQAHTKTSSGYRTLSLPRFVTEVLLRRSVVEVPTEVGVVFPSSAGTLWDPHNLRRALRDALKSIEGFEWVTPHVFRKSVATLIDAEATLEAAAAILGHSGTSVTSAHYIAKAAIAPDMSSILEQFGNEKDE